MTDAERRAALEAIAAEVRVCTRCRLHETAGPRRCPAKATPSTEVVFVGEGPGFNEDQQGRPFVGRAGDLLVKLLGSIGWRREDVFITNIVKCRPPDNRDPEPDEIAACAPVPAPPARGARPGAGRHARPLLDGAVHARRAHLAGARHGAPGRSRHGRPRRAGLRHVPPGGGAARRRPSSARATPTPRPSRPSCWTRGAAGAGGTVATSTPAAVARPRSDADTGSPTRRADRAVSGRAASPCGGTTQRRHDSTPTS